MTDETGTTKEALWQVELSAFQLKLGWPTGNLAEREVGRLER